MSLIDNLLKRFDDVSGLEDPAAWLFGNNEAKSGIVVDEEKAMRYSAVHGAVKVLAESVASLPLNVYKNLEPRGKEKVKDHHLYKILHSQPNNIQSSYNYREVKMAHLALWGNFYAEIERNNRGEPVALWPIKPSVVKPRLNETKDEILYDIKTKKGQATFSRLSIFHIPGLGFDGIKGKSVIGMAREAIGLGLVAEEFGATFFSEGAHPGGIIEYPGSLGDDAYNRYVKEMRQKYNGLGKSHKLMVLEEGLKYHQTSIPPEDAQFLQTRKYQVEEIARMYRIPPHMLADLDNATFSNIEEQNINFVVHTLRPWLVRIEQAYNMQLFSDDDEHFCEFVVDGLLRGDIETRYEAYATARQWGWLSANDIRALENMNPLPDGQGDVYLVPLNMISAKDLTELNPENRKSKELLELDRPADEYSASKRSYDLAKRSAAGRRRYSLNYKPVFKRKAQAAIDFEVEEVRKIIKESSGLTGLLTNLEKFYDEYEEVFSKEMRPVIFDFGRSIADLAASEVDLDEIDDLDSFLEDYLENLTNRYVHFSENQLSALAQEVVDESKHYEEVADAVDNRLAEWEEKRAEKVAEEQVFKENGAVSKYVYVAAGITRLIWVAMGKDPCPYCLALDGKVVGINSNFVSEGEEIEVEGEETFKSGGNKAHPPLHEKCQCGISPERG